jgi:hypothetical protein
MQSTLAPPALPIVTRKEAKALGLKRYFTGKPCPQGHVAERHVSSGSCFACSNARTREYREANPEKFRERGRSYREANPEKFRERGRSYRDANLEKARKRSKSWRDANLEKAREQARAWRDANLEKAREYSRGYHQANLEKARKRSKSWRDANPDYYKTRRAADSQHAISCRLRGRLGCAIRRAQAPKHASAIGDSGLTPSQLLAHIERQFVWGMAWHNRELWHIDHIRPLASFDLTDPEQQRAACHYTNLQPLWGAENLRKHASWEEADALESAS